MPAGARQAARRMRASPGSRSRRPTPPLRSTTILRCARRRRWWRSAGPVLAGLLLCALLLVIARPALATSSALQGQWRSADTTEPPPPPAADAAGWQTFDPAVFTRFANPDEQAWLVLRPAGGSWPQPPWVLSVINVGLQTVILHAPDGEPVASARLGWREGSAWPAHGRLAFVLTSALPADAPLLLRVDSRGAIAAPMRFAAQPAGDFVHSDGIWLALASACLAIMLAMAVVALLFALRLRDPTFLYYAIFITGYAFVLALQSGYVYAPLGWSALAQEPRLWGRCTVALSIVAAALFFMHFVDLERYSLRARRLLLGYVAIVGVLALAGFVPGGSELGRLLINPLLILGAVLFLGVAALAAWRGSFYARLFMLGWTPLLLATVLGSAQLYGVTRGWIWSDEAAFVCGAVEALVFSLALAYRTLGLRLAYEQARLQADVDPLTGLFNRRGWSLRAAHLEAAAHDGAPLSLLFIDIDLFKQLNDRVGHHAGDIVLRRLADAIRHELRRDDVCGRYGGEEFVVALPATAAAQAVQIAERIRNTLLTRYEPGEARATISVGVAALLRDETMPMLLRRADRAMYAAKRSGRDRVVLASANEDGADAP